MRLQIIYRSQLFSTVSILYFPLPLLHCPIRTHIRIQLPYLSFIHLLSIPIPPSPSPYPPFPLSPSSFSPSPLLPFFSSSLLSIFSAISSIFIHASYPSCPYSLPPYMLSLPYSPFLAFPPSLSESIIFCPPPHFIHLRTWCVCRSKPRSNDDTFDYDPCRMKCASNGIPCFAGIVAIILLLDWHYL